MSDQLGNDRERHFEVEEDSPSEETVRILPEPYDVRPFNTETGSLRREIRPGTLYTQAADAPVRAYEPESQPYDRNTRKSTERDYSQQEQALAPRPYNETRPVVQARRGPSSCAILAATFSLLALSCAVLVFATFQGGLDSLSKLGGIFPRFDIPLTPTVTIDTQRPAVIEKIRALSKLETVHYEMEKVVSGKSTTSLPEFLVGDKILLVAHGEVVAGIDLSKVQPEDIVVEEHRVTIRVPKPEILYSKLDNDKSYVYDRETGIFSKPDPNLETQIRQAAEQEIVKAALEDGILTKAQANGEQVIRTLITGLGYPEVDIIQEP